MKKKRDEMGYDISDRMKDWYKYMSIKTSKDFKHIDFAQKCGIHFTTLSAYYTGRIKVGGENLAKIAEGFGLTVSEFLAGPWGEQKDKENGDQDSLYECKAATIKELICAGCAVPEIRRKHYCKSNCVLDKYFRLCCEVANGQVTIGEIEERLRHLKEECLKAANAASDRETGYVFDMTKEREEEAENEI
jgi:transcriptional regulator with XRE-family HTH domain